MQESASEDRRSSILRAAQRLFARYGLTKVTMDEIASEVGMGKASLYYYFPNKEDLFRAVVDHQHGEFLQHLQPIMTKDAPASSKLFDYVDQRLQYFQQLACLNMAPLQSQTEGKPVFSELFAALVVEDIRMLTQILKQGEEAGELRLASAEKQAELLAHILQGMRLRVLRKYNGDFEKGCEELRVEAQMLIDLLLHGMERRS